MNKSKEINGKHYQQCNVVLLATKREYTQFDPELKDHYTIVRHNLKELYITNLPWSKKYSSEVHIYITSDEEIKEGDWYYCKGARTDAHGLVQATKRIIEIGVNDNEEFKKVIATTDSSLDLPQPSKQFIQKYIEEYNKGNKIGKVLVEYSETCINCTTEGENCSTLKIDSHNCITIKPIKDSYTREEVATLIRRCFGGVEGKYEVKEPLLINKWIEENL